MCCCFYSLISKAARWHVFYTCYRIQFISCNLGVMMIYFRSLSYKTLTWAYKESIRQSPGLAECDVMWKMTTGWRNLLAPWKVAAGTQILWEETWREWCLSASRLNPLPMHSSNQRTATGWSGWGVEILSCCFTDWCLSLFRELR